MLLEGWVVSLWSTPPPPPPLGDIPGRRILTQPNFLKCIVRLPWNRKSKSKIRLGPVSHLWKSKFCDAISQSKTTSAPIRHKRLYRQPAQLSQQPEGVLIVTPKWSHSITVRRLFIIAHGIFFIHQSSIRRFQTIHRLFTKCLSWAWHGIPPS